MCILILSLFSNLAELVGQDKSKICHQSEKQRKVFFLLQTMHGNSFKEGVEMHCLKKKTKLKVKFPSGFTGCCCYQSRRGKLHFSASEYIFSSSCHQTIFRHEIFVPIFTILKSNIQMENLTNISEIFNSQMPIFSLSTSSHQVATSQYSDMKY